MTRMLGGLRTQLMLLMAGSMLATLAALALYMVREQTAFAQLGIEQHIGSTARSIALGAENDIVTGRLDVVEELLLRSADQPGVTRALITDAQGRVLAQVKREVHDRPGLHPVFGDASQRLQVPTELRPLLLASDDGRTLSAWEPVLAGRLIAWVRVDHDTEALGTIRYGIWRSALGACGLALLGTLLLLHRLLRQPLKAVKRARDFAADLGQANGHQMADEVGAHEVRDLVGALNRASVQLCSQRKAIEAQVAQLRLQEAELELRNQRLAMLFALCPDGIVSFDGDDVVDFANPAFARLLGLAPDEVVGRSLAWLDDQLRAASAQPQGWTPLALAFEPAATGASRRTAIQLVRPRPVDLALKGVQGQAPTATRLLYVRDVTHETEVDRLKSEFLSTAAHELRTPMVSIYGFAELLQAGNFPEVHRAEMVATIHRQSKSMVAILNELLDLARIEARRGVDFEFSVVDLAALVHVAVGDFGVPAQREPPRVQVPAGELPVRADKGKLAQVLGNLLSNAYKYSPRGGPVCLALHRDGPDVVLEVSDHGIGMTPAQLARVCERFYRADASGAIPGTGLGMSIVKEIVELHCGRLQLRSEPGQGTTVSVRLPMVEERAAAVQSRGQGGTRTAALPSPAREHAEHIA